jgi:hypothetical protein
VLWLLLVLVVTNLLTAGVVLVMWRLRPREDLSAPTPEVAEVLTNLARQPGALGGTRRIISVEILNPIELAGTRGRVMGIAGSIAPGITRRVVYDQAMKTMRRTFIEQQVVADLRLHTLRPQRTGAPAAIRTDDSYVDVVEPGPTDIGEPPFGSEPANE